MPKKSTEYFLTTGQQDADRLTIINQLYNPGTLDFIQQSGLTTGMTVLEIGCGTGHMAVELAKRVGPSGKVIASDICPKQLVIAQKTATEAQCTNIEFIQLDINQPMKIDPVDMIYGRWVIEFAQNTAFTVNELCRHLKPEGIFVYEGVDVSDTEYFCYPPHPTVNHWFQLILRNWISNHMDLSFVKNFYYDMKRKNISNLQITANQIILTTPREKSILRQGLTSVKDTYFRKNFITPIEYEQMIEDFKGIENSPAIIGYVRNILVSARCAQYQYSSL